MNSKAAKTALLSTAYPPDADAARVHLCRLSCLDYRHGCLAINHDLRSARWQTCMSVLGDPNVSTKECRAPIVLCSLLRYSFGIPRHDESKDEHPAEKCERLNFTQEATTLSGRSCHIAARRCYQAVYTWTSLGRFRDKSNTAQRVKLQN